MKIEGKYNTAKIYTDNIEDSTKDQVMELCNQDTFKDSNIRIMPDCHAGKGCVIGTTMTVSEKIVPNLVGVDIGCGMLTVELGKIELNLERIDNYIRKNIPHGFKINERAQVDYKKEIEKLLCLRELTKSSKEFNRALGSLGSGNHFIEINEDSETNRYLIIHSGSRNLGNQVATYYQKKACDYHGGLDENFEKEKLEMMKRYKEKGKKKQIKKALIELKKEHHKETEIPSDLCYLEGRLMYDYLHDMDIIQKYADINRIVIAKKIIEDAMNLDFSKLSRFQTIHNYIDVNNMILRKGAISSQKGEKMLIPINMKDGCILAVGKGNKEWNYSAPHGAGRVLSRGDAKKKLCLEEFKDSTKDIFTSSVNESTLDESPMAYKDIDEIISNTKETIDIIDILKPIYNFKSSKID